MSRRRLGLSGRYNNAKKKRFQVSDTRNARERKKIMKKRKVAIFDIDGTIFRSSLLIEVVEGLVAARIFPKNTREAYQKSYQNWLDRQGTYETYIWDVIRVFEKNIKGVRHQDFKKVVKKVVDVNKNKVYTFTRDLVADLKKRKY